MPNTIKAVFEEGVLRPLEKVDLVEHEEVEIVILHGSDDIPSTAITQLAQESGSFDFLADPAEDIYTQEDGEPISHA